MCMCTCVSVCGMKFDEEGRVGWVKKNGEGKRGGVHWGKGKRGGGGRSNVNVAVKV